MAGAVRWEADPSRSDRTCRESNAIVGAGARMGARAWGRAVAARPGGRCGGCVSRGRADFEGRAAASGARLSSGNGSLPEGTRRPSGARRNGIGARRTGCTAGANLTPSEHANRYAFLVPVTTPRRLSATRRFSATWLRLERLLPPARLSRTHDAHRCGASPTAHPRFGLDESGARTTADTEQPTQNEHGHANEFSGDE